MRYTGKAMRLNNIEIKLLVAGFLILGAVAVTSVIGDPNFDPAAGEAAKSETLLAENKQPILNNMGAWIMYWRRMRPGFSWLNVIAASEERMKPVKTGRWDEPEEKKKLYMASADGRYVADLYGGVEIKVTDGKTEVTEGKKRWVDVADRTKERFTRIISCDGECGITHAKWLDNSRLAVGVWRKDGKCLTGCQVDPAVEIYDFSNNKRIVFLTNVKVDEVNLLAWSQISQIGLELTALKEGKK